MLEDTLNDKEGEVTKVEHTLKYAEEEVKFLKDYNQKLLDSSKKEEENTKISMVFINSIKAILNDDTKKESNRLTAVSDYLNSNENTDDPDSKPFED